MTGTQYWTQHYLLFGHGLGVSCLLAALPIFTLLLVVGILRRAAWLAGVLGLVVTLLLATVGYRMPVPMALSAAGMGVAFALFPITWIIFWALALFRVTVETGQFAVIRDSIGQLTPDPRLQALLIAFALGAFLEGAAGFGTPVAIAATMLVGLGFTPFRASAICLIANTAPVAFGSLGIPIITLAATTGLPLARLSTATAAMCTPVAVLLPLYMLLATGGRRAVSGIWLPTLASGAIFGAVEVAVSVYLGPQLTDILASLSAIAALVLPLRWRPAPPAPGDLEGWPSRGIPGAVSGGRGNTAGVEPRAQSQPGATFRAATFRAATFRAWMPYGLLVACVLLWGWSPVQRALGGSTRLVPWPLLHDAVTRVPPIVRAPAPYHALFTLNLLAASGTACMAATLLSAVWLRLAPRRFVGILMGVSGQLGLPTLTVAAVLGLAFLMNYCGATATLGLAFATTGRLFPFFSALLGWLGVFLTGSDTSANALFGSLPVVTATRLGFSPVLMAAANSSGGVMGKMISLQTIAIAAAATGLTAKEQARLFRFTLRHSIALAALTGGIALGLAYVIHPR
ncbi:MAG TPA: L-lactate permease [Acidobacteriaceae bacterium]